MPGIFAEHHGDVVAGNLNVGSLGKFGGCRPAGFRR